MISRVCPPRGCILSGMNEGQGKLSGPSYPAKFSVGVAQRLSMHGDETFTCIRKVVQRLLDDDAFVCYVLYILCILWYTGKQSHVTGHSIISIGKTGRLGPRTLASRACNGDTVQRTMY